ncbi:hypothetical protein [Rhodophyticola sp.]|uniref:hypothetical protein n=1 Tax=Rhodophyticola sp. TaxID=2680032 RepID=UPI003D29AA78
MTDIYAIVPIFLIIASAVWAILAYRRDTGSAKPPKTQDEISLVRNASQATVTWTHVATSLGGAVTISFIGLIYRDGTFMLAIGISFILGLLIYRAILPVVYERFHSNPNVSSFEEYLSCESSVLLFFVSCVNFFIFFLLTTAQFTAAYLLFDWLGIDYRIPLLIILMAIAGSYVAYGLRGVFLTEKIQVVAVCAWLLVLIAYCLRFSSVESIAQLDIMYLSGLANGPVVLMLALILFPLTAIARSDLWQRSFSCSSHEQAQGAISRLMIVMAFIYALMGVVGITIFSLNPDLSNYNNAAYTVLDSSNPIVSLLAVTGILAALVSTADSSLNLTAVAALNIRKAIMGNRAPQKAYIFYIVSLALILICIFFLILNDVDLGSVVLLASTAGALLLPTLGALVLIKEPLIYSKVISIIFGAMAAIATLAITGDATIAFIPGFFVSLIVVGLGWRVEPSFGIAKIGSGE